MRHYIGCDGDSCERALYLNAGERLSLELEPTNEFDKNAVKIIYQNNDHIGYLPRYYSESVTEYLKEGAKYECGVVEVNKDRNCHECIKIKLELYIDVKQMKKIS